MEKRDDIAILDLLRQREAELVKVWQCEEAICGILGVSSYPFEGAPMLPSRVKGKRTVKVGVSGRSGVRGGASGSSALSSKDTSSLPGIRKLRFGEDAYRVVFEHCGERETSFQTDGDLIRKLFLLVGDDFKIELVETVVFRDLEDWDSQEELWRI